MPAVVASDADWRPRIPLPYEPYRPDSDTGVAIRRPSAGRDEVVGRAVVSLREFPILSSSSPATRAATSPRVRAENVRVHIRRYSVLLYNHA